MSERYKYIKHLKFYQANVSTRHILLRQEFDLSEKEVRLLQNGLTDPEIGDKAIESFVGYFSLPLGLTEPLNIDGKKVRIPLAVEESSVVAALNKGIKVFNNTGTIQSTICTKTITGHTYFKNPSLGLIKYLSNNCQEIIAHLHRTFPTFRKYKMGMIRLSHERILIENEIILKVATTFNVSEIMGANLVTQVSESLKRFILTNFPKAQPVMSILSNNSHYDNIKTIITLKGFDPRHGERIELASKIAENDDDRAATHNKGILNAIDPVLIATGNDWRASNSHIYSTYLRGQKTLSTWRYINGDLVGTIALPLQFGLKGGMTKIHPGVALNLKFLGNPDSTKLMQILAISGLLQNYSALFALTGKGIIEGHMSLHLSNIALEVKCESHEYEDFINLATLYLKENHVISPSIGKQILNDIRGMGLRSS